jgi:hypothetical protein
MVGRQCLGDTSAGGENIMMIPRKEYKTLGLNTLSVLGLMITAGVIWSAITPWWLILATPLMLIGFGCELHEQKSHQIQL